VDAILFTPKEQWSEVRIAEGWAGVEREISAWEAAIKGEFLAGNLSAADFTLYPEIALALRIAGRKAGLVPAAPLGPRLAAWKQRMEALPITKKTWPPHWK